jgi:thiamine-monophosphate kinase
LEFDLIRRIRERAPRRADVHLGIGDDAALLRVPAGQLLALSTDTLNAGVHFPPETTASDLGWKALAVNLSDLAAMGAMPAWCTLSLSLPEADAAWIDAFLDGFLALAGEHEVALVGGDTTRGPLSITVAVQGFVPETLALRRDGARAGDDIWITGTTGEAAGALAQWRAGGAIDPGLRARLDRPTPRIAAGLALRGLASACIDVSDGLLADLGHVLAASGIGAELELVRWPVSTALQSHFDDDARIALQLGGGDDYQLCFTAAPDRRAAIEAALAPSGTPATRIGTTCSEPGIRVLGTDGQPWHGTARGWDHFGETG